MAKKETPDTFRGTGHEQAKLLSQICSFEHMAFTDRHLSRYGVSGITQKGVRIIIEQAFS